jgi:bacteriophage N4 adsorption protein B
MELIYDIFHAMAYVVAIGILIAGVDDFFFDMQYVRRLLRRRNRPRISIEELRNEPERLIALFVPAWMEGGVVNRMAEYAVKVLEYEKYEIFIGVYPNDPETCACVDQITITCPRIRKVLMPHPGPTSKADCLNAIYRAMKEREIPGVREYQIMALHDSEDILHPLTLKLYNFFVPQRLDMAQIPVFPLELCPWRYWVGNTYLDQFGETHVKDMFARMELGGVLPSAGVGTAFSRKAMETLELVNKGDPFRIGNLTEDYITGVEIRREGLRAGFVNYPVKRRVRKKKEDGSPGAEKVVTDFVAVRENFPRTFNTAVRQRSRWILGIAFQGWEQAGWDGSAAVRYTLYRDRRAPVIHILNGLGYLVFLYGVIEYFVLRSPMAANVYLRPLFDPNTMLFKLVIVDTCILLYRFAQKMVCIQQIFGLRQGIFSMLRMPVDNLVNFCATMRAIWMYLGHRFFGKPLVWLKTTHIFPGQAELAEFTRSIEDLLLEEGHVTKEALDQARQQQKGVSAPLALLRLGLIDEVAFTSVWARHSSMSVEMLDPAEVPLKLLNKIPERESMDDGLLPMGFDEKRIKMGFREPPGDARVQELQSRLGSPITRVLVTPSNLAFARNKTYPKLILGEPARPSLLKVLEKESSIPKEALMDAAQIQFGRRQSLVDILVEKRVLQVEVAIDLWSKAIGLPPFHLHWDEVDMERVRKIGTAFCILHRMVPVGNGRVIASEPPHTRAVEWLEKHFQGKVEFFTALPRHIELVLHRLRDASDPDRRLLDVLQKKGAMKSEDADRLKRMRPLVQDPFHVLVRRLNLATEMSVAEAFREVVRIESVFPRVKSETLESILPPGFVGRTGCRPVEVKSNSVVLSLERFPTNTELLDLYERLSGYPVYYGMRG